MGHIINDTICSRSVNSGSYEHLQPALSSDQSLVQINDADDPTVSVEALKPGPPAAT